MWAETATCDGIAVSDVLPWWTSRQRQAESRKDAVMAYQLDELSKALASGVSRRDVLKRIGAGLTGAVLASVGTRRATAAPSTCAVFCAEVTQSGPANAQCRQACRQCGNDPSLLCGGFGRPFICCAPNSSCCFSQTGEFCCPSGTECCGEGCCASGTCCFTQDGPTCCPSGQTCAYDPNTGTGTCVPTA